MAEALVFLRDYSIGDNNDGVGRVRRACRLSNANAGVGRVRGIYNVSKGLETTTEALTKGDEHK